MEGFSGFLRAQGHHNCHSHPQRSLTWESQVRLRQSSGLPARDTGLPATGLLTDLAQSLPVCDQKQKGCNGRCLRDAPIELKYECEKYQSCSHFDRKLRQGKWMLKRKKKKYIKVQLQTLSWADNSFDFTLIYAAPRALNFRGGSSGRTLLSCSWI